MQDGPLVSICIPVYNGDRFIDETLRCCLGQTYGNIEVVISDNGSTDRTVERILTYDDPRIRLHRSETNIGLIGNYRKVLSLATGKYMGFLGADDGMERDAVEKAVKVMEAPENRDVVLVNTYIDIIDDESKVVFSKRSPFRGGRFSSSWGIRSNFLYGSNLIGEPNGSLFRKEAYDRIPEPKFRNGNTWTIDLDMKLELLLQGEGYMIPETLGKFRISSRSTSARDLRFSQARLFREYALAIHRDRRYGLSFFWVMTAAVDSLLLQAARHLFYLLFIRSKENG